MEFIDGHPVTRHRVRFRNTIEISETNADLVKDGMVVCWILRARCAPPSYVPVAKDEEDRVRVAIQAIEAAVPVEGDLRDSVLAFLEHGANQLFVTDDGEVTFPFEKWLGEPSINRLATFLQGRDRYVVDQDPIETAIDLLGQFLPDPVNVGFASSGAEELPATTDVVSPYLNNVPGDVEVIGSIYHKTKPRWMEEPDT